MCLRRRRGRGGFEVYEQEKYATRKDEDRRRCSLKKKKKKRNKTIHFGFIHAN